MMCLLAVICVLTIWTIGHARDCGDQQNWINNRCCDMCPPGEYVKEFCTEHRQTVCSPCNEGHFLNQYSTFDRCQECQSCQHDYAEKCTRTANAKCSCRSGFLCSNNVCSTCEENTCVTGEKLNKTVISMDQGLIKYSYRCEPACPGNAYFDANKNICKPWTQCSAHGLAELTPGNQTHNSVCDFHGMMQSNGRAPILVILSIGFVLLTLSLLAFLFFACIKNQRKNKSNDNPIYAVSADTIDFHLSKEESGMQFITHDEHKEKHYW